MFDSVLERNLPRRQVGRGASFSLAFHAVLVVGAVYLSSRPHGQLGSTQAIPFGAGMERPTPLRQPAPVYTQQAMAARLESTAILKCVITEDGSLQNCKIIKHVPLEMDGPLLAAVSQWKYTPVM